MSKTKVAVLKTNPKTVLEDYGRLMRLAGYTDYLSKEKDTALKINISWHHFYPACSTTPWQLEGVIKALLADGYERSLIHGCHNRTVVVSARKGEVTNKHKSVLEKYKLRNIHLYEKEPWIRYEPKGKMLVLDEIFPKGIHIPKRLVGENIIHLPTMKTHVFTTMTGAMKNAFGGLLHEKRHWTHSVIHETLVDLLTIQKEIHPGIFAVMDGTFAGDGPGPRCMVPHIKNYVLAGSDQVAIDAVAARMMGFEPMSLKFIRLAHEAGLGCGDISEIEVIGEDISGVNFGFRGNLDTFASRGQKMIYWGPLKPLEKTLLRTFIAPWSYLASVAYHDWYWYPMVGKKRVREMLETDWENCFRPIKVVRHLKIGLSLALEIWRLLFLSRRVISSLDQRIFFFRKINRTPSRLFSCIWEYICEGILKVVSPPHLIFSITKILRQYTISLGTLIEWKEFPGGPVSRDGIADVANGDSDKVL